MGSTLKPGGIRAVCDDFKSVFVMGAYGLGAVYQNFEVITAGFTPGMFVDPGAATVGTEEQCTIGATTSVLAYGHAEVDFGVVANCSVAYVATDSVPVIMYHWNPGALLRNLPTTDPGGDKGPGVFAGTTSGTAGRIQAAELSTGCNIRTQDFILNAAVDDIVGWIETFAP